MSSPLPCLRSTPKGVELDVVVQPRASRSQVAGLHDGRLKLMLAAPPVDGEANQELVAVVAEMLGVPKRDVALLRGQTGRRKTLVVAGLTLEEAMGKLSERVS